MVWFHENAISDWIISSTVYVRLVNFPYFVEKKGKSKGTLFGFTKNYFI